MEEARGARKGRTGEERGGEGDGWEEEEEDEEER
jgi:hypothetical protein